MIPDNVTLIVKAPNQQVEDQNIECQSSWTVRQLKGHLSEVYPSKPKTEEQKIIYSGQLLDDNTILKDVLRTYESQIAHTMHLVCTPTKRMPEPQPVPQPSSDGLRHRTAAPADPPRAETRQNDQNHSVEMAQYLSSLAPPPADPAALASHMMLMHQAYLQYMQHYARPAARRPARRPARGHAGGGPAPLARGARAATVATRCHLDDIHLVLRLPHSGRQLNWEPPAFGTNTPVFGVHRLCGVKFTCFGVTASIFGVNFPLMR